MHKKTSTNGMYGFDIDNTIGATPQVKTGFAIYTLSDGSLISLFLFMSYSPTSGQSRGPTSSWNIAWATCSSCAGVTAQPSPMKRRFSRRLVTGLSS
jgi:hypothetical protein